MLKIGVFNSKIMIKRENSRKHKVAQDFLQMHLVVRPLNSYVVDSLNVKEIFR